VSLRLRLAFIVGITFAAVVIACVFAAHVSARNQLHAETDRFLLQRAHDPGIEHAGPGFLGSGNGDHDDNPFFVPDAYTQIVDKNGTVHTPPGQPQLPIRSPGFHDITVDGTHYRMLSVQTDAGTVQIARDISASDHVLSTLDMRLFLIAIAGTLFAALAAWLIARRIVRPVEKLTGAAEHVAETQDLGSRIEVERRDEIGKLADSFNTMLVALDTSRDQQKRLVMDASHELRTPLTALRTNMEVLQRSSKMDDEQRARLLREANLELTELSDLVGELVDLATDARAEEPLQHVDLGELTTEVVERYRRRNAHTINIEISHAASVNVRESALERALSNLVDNACKFSPVEMPVDVVVSKTTVEVRDRGPGIASEDRAHVFDRFYRATSSRAMAGSGLGLSIVAQIATLHGATVDLAPRDGGGTIARFTLPPTSSTLLT
jgi:two-component system sensor histidine kinase MprB